MDQGAVFLSRRKIPRRLLDCVLNIRIARGAAIGDRGARELGVALRHLVGGRMIDQMDDVGVARRRQEFRVALTGPSDAGWPAAACRVLGPAGARAVPRTPPDAPWSGWRTGSVSGARAPRQPWPAHRSI